jgi:hypothetical protein
MSMTSKDWRDMASVFLAGAERQRQYCYNTERQQQAESLEAQARRCEQLAAENEQQDTSQPPGFSS